MKHRKNRQIIKYLKASNITEAFLFVDHETFYSALDEGRIFVKNNNFYFTDDEGVEVKVIVNEHVDQVKLYDE